MYIVGNKGFVWTILVVTVPANAFVGFATLLFQWVVVHYNFSLYNWKQITNYIPPTQFGWWLSQPIEKIGSPKCTIFPKFRGENSQNYLEKLPPPTKHQPFNSTTWDSKKTFQPPPKCSTFLFLFYHPFKGEKVLPNKKFKHQGRHSYSKPHLWEVVCLPFLQVPQWLPNQNLPTSTRPGRPTPRGGIDQRTEAGRCDHWKNPPFKNRKEVNEGKYILLVVEPTRKICSSNWIPFLQGSGWQ